MATPAPPGSPGVLDEINDRLKAIDRKVNVIGVIAAAAAIIVIAHEVDRLLGAVLGERIGWISAIVALVGGALIVHRTFLR
jgi:hypothetical protein